MTEQKTQCISLKAGEDLSAAQFFLVKLDSNGDVVKAAAKTDRAIGIVQNAPASGAPAQVCVGGKSKCVTGSALAVGVLVGSDSAGKGTAITVAAGGTVYNYAVGMVTEASGAAGGFAQVVVFGGGQPLLV
ncbi:MAG: hypothetical protein AB7I42_23060 [Bradyrhizobium sp.]|uniref:hypothetical protein n=1 Tax=Bradyrhizobium sp. TaxID=376 RepID=UPI003D1490C2